MSGERIEGATPLANRVLTPSLGWGFGVTVESDGKFSTVDAFDPASRISRAKSMATMHRERQCRPHASKKCSDQLR